MVDCLLKDIHHGVTIGKIINMSKKSKKWKVIYWCDIRDKQVIEGYDTHEEALTRQYKIMKNNPSQTVRIELR